MAVNRIWFLPGPLSGISRSDRSLLAIGYGGALVTWAIVDRDSVTWTLTAKPFGTPVDGIFTEVGQDGGIAIPPVSGFYADTGDGWSPVSFTYPPWATASKPTLSPGDWPTVTVDSTSWAYVTKPT
jgi:hypothetical protein